MILFFYVSLVIFHKCQLLFGAEDFQQFIFGGSLLAAPAVWRTWHEEKLNKWCDEDLPLHHQPTLAPRWSGDEWRVLFT